jgi:hypothetical protein
MSYGGIKVGNSAIQLHDRHFHLSWSLTDEKKLRSYTMAMAFMHGLPEYEEEYNRRADELIALAEKRHNDHHNSKATLLGHDWLDVEPLESTGLEPDMVTFQGANKLLKIYFGSASGVFKYIARGTTAATPTPYSTALTTETGSRTDASTAGFHSISGVSIRLLSSYASSTATATMFQIGAFDATSAGIMLAIHDFGATGLAHVVNVDAFSLGMIIDLAPIGDV